MSVLHELRTLAVLGVSLIALATVGAEELELEYAEAQRGLLYAQLIQESPPNVAHIARIDLNDDALRIEVIKAHGKETLQKMVARVRDQGHRVLAAVNGDYFMDDTRIGLPEGIHIEEGRIFFGPSRHTMFALDDKNRPLIAPTEFKGQFRIGRGRWIDLLGYNLPEGHRKAELGSVAYTRDVQENTPPNIRSREWLIDGLESGLIVGEECSGIIRERKTGGGMDVPADGVVISVVRDIPPDLRAAKMGDEVTFRLVLPRIKGRVHQAVGGGPMLLHQGRPCIDMAGEGFTPGQIAYLYRRKHPRTAVGYDRKQRYLYLVTVEGRAHGRDGMTFDELAKLMQQIGTYEAMALDGGASSAMFVENMVVQENQDPSGKATSRLVANSLAVSLADMGAVTTPDEGEK